MVLRNEACPYICRGKLVQLWRGQGTIDVAIFGRVTPWEPIEGQRERAMTRPVIVAELLMDEAHESQRRPRRCRLCIRRIEKMMIEGLAAFQSILQVDVLRRWRFG